MLDRLAAAELVSMCPLRSLRSAAEVVDCTFWPRCIVNVDNDTKHFDLCDLRDNCLVAVGPARRPGSGAKDYLRNSHFAIDLVDFIAEPC
jgi:hypothetical protein